MVCCNQTAPCAASPGRLLQLPVELAGQPSSPRRQPALGQTQFSTAHHGLQCTYLADTQRCWCKGIFWGAVTRRKWLSSKRHNNSVTLNLLLINAGQQHRGMTMDSLCTPSLPQSARHVGYSHPDTVWSPMPVCCSLPLHLTGLGEDQLPPSLQSGAGAELPNTRQSLSLGPWLPQPRSPDPP